MVALADKLTRASGQQALTVANMMLNVSARRCLRDRLAEGRAEVMRSVICRVVAGVARAGFSRSKANVVTGSTAVDASRCSGGEEARRRMDVG